MIPQAFPLYAAVFTSPSGRTPGLALVVGWLPATDVDWLPEWPEKGGEDGIDIVLPAPGMFAPVLVALDGDDGPHAEAAQNGDRVRFSMSRAEAAQWVRDDR